MSLSHLGLGRRLKIALLATVLLASAGALLFGTRLSGETRDRKTALGPTAKADAQARSLASLPLFFEPNQGQTDARVKFLARGSGYGLFLTGDSAVLKLASPKNADNATVAMRLEGANSSAVARGSQLLPGKSNYLVGNDSKSGTRTLVNSHALSMTRCIPESISFTTGTREHLNTTFE